jgi:spore germination protein GerM
MDRRAAVVGCVLALGAAGCGVRDQPRPVRLPADEVRSSLQSTSPTQTSRRPTPTQLYLVRHGRLTAVRGLAEGVADARAAVTSLFTAPPPRLDVSTAIPPGSRPRHIEISGRVMTVDVSPAFTRVTGGEQILAVAQIVFTATERSTVTAVRVTVDGRPIPMPTDSGVTTGPVARKDFRSVAPPAPR